MMRRFMVMVFVPLFAVLAFFISIGFLQPDIAVKYNGQPVHFEGAKPEMQDGGRNSRLLVPADLLAAALGAAAHINPDEKSLRIQRNASVLTFYDDADRAVVDGRETAMPSRAVYKGGHFFVPARFFCESLGKLVIWESATNTVNILDGTDYSFLSDPEGKNYISTDRFAVKSGQLVFFNSPGQSPSQADYLPDIQLNPDINRQIFETVKMLAGKNHYLHIDYQVKSANSTIDPAPYISLSLANSQNTPADSPPRFSFTFYEKAPANPAEIWRYRRFSRGAVIKLELNQLYDSGRPAAGWTDPFYEDKLKLAFIALFQENTGLNIYQYLLEEYNHIRNDTEGEYSNIKKARRFGSIKVDLAYAAHPNSAGTVYVYFSYFNT